MRREAAQAARRAAEAEGEAKAREATEHAAEAHRARVALALLQQQAAGEKVELGGPCPAACYLINPEKEPEQ